MTRGLHILAAGMEWADHIPGGLNQYFADYLKAMKEYGHTVEGLVSGEGEELSDYGAPAYIRNVIPPHRHTKPTTMLRMRAFQSACRERTARFRPDIFNPHFGLYAAMVLRRSLPDRVPIVTHFHGPWAMESKVEDDASGALRQIKFRMKRTIEREIYRRSDRYIVLSRYFGELLAREYGVPSDSIHVIPGAVDTARFHPHPDRSGLRRQLGLGQSDFVCFCARRLVKRMNLDSLVRAMAAVTRHTPGIVMAIAGTGPLKSELEQLIRELGLEARVRMLGRISGEDLVRWYQAADVSVVPTLTLEGFGMVTTESLACGTPVLGTPYGGTKEILSELDGNLLFGGHSPEAIAKKLIALLSGEWKLPERDRCRDYVMRHYTWSRVASAVTRVFEEAAEARKENRSQ